MNSGRSLKVTCGLSLSSIYKRMRAALKSIHWILRGWETVLYSILYHSCYITQTATELKHSEGGILIQLCLLHGGRLDVSAFKSFCELFHLESRLFSMAEECGGITVNPCSESLMPLDRGFLFIFLYFSPMKQGLCASNYWACCQFQNRMKNAHDRAIQSTWWQQSQAALMNPWLETLSNACDVTMAFVLCWWGSFQLSADLRVSKGSWQLSLVILLPAMISNVT